jgi:hypothetical protein
MWLCLKHHHIVDGAPQKYTVSNLKQWKATREAQEPGQRYIDGLTEERLRQVIDESFANLVGALGEMDFPGTRDRRNAPTSQQRHAKRGRRVNARPGKLSDADRGYGVNADIR